jgi:hypothetical protein
MFPSSSADTLTPAGLLALVGLLAVGSVAAAEPTKKPDAVTLARTERPISRAKAETTTREPGAPS